MISSLKPLVMRHSDRESGIYFLFANDGGLYRCDIANQTSTLIAQLENISERKKPLRIDCHYPYVCVTERFGLNCALVDLSSGAVKTFLREDYHADVSSYSVGFLQYEGRTLFIHQTQWNRLDIIALQSGVNLTEREVYCRLVSEGYRDGTGKYINAVFDKKNHSDLFHSLLHVAPDSRNFLSNGWVWSPQDHMMVYNLNTFLSRFEPSGYTIDYYNGYNWDRPCTFIDSDRFVIATDNNIEDLEDEPKYRQLWFYRISDALFDEKRYVAYKKVACELFPVNEYGEVSGELYYDCELAILIALSASGAWLLTTEGEIKNHLPDIMFNEDTQGGVLSWQYNSRQHCFYRWDGKKQSLDTYYINKICT